MSEQPPSNLIKRILGSLGPAIITASVVLGPGSILSASKIGHTYAYQMNWVLVIAVIFLKQVFQQSLSHLPRWLLAIFSNGLLYNS